MRRVVLAGLAMVSGCHELFSLDHVTLPPDAPIDAPPPDAPEPPLSKWTTATTLPVARDYNFQHGAFVHDTLFLVGGYQSQIGEVATVYRAPFTAAGLGAWTTTGPLPVARALGDVVTTADRIYALGGANFAAAQSTVYTAAPDASGSIASWSALVSLPEPRKAHGAAVHGSFVYVVGGADVTNARQSTVYVARVRTDGGLDPWQTTTALPGPRANGGVVAARGHLYAIAGDESDTTKLATVIHAPIDATTGALGAWTQTTPLPVERASFAAVTDGSSIYVIGGVRTSATNEVLFTQIGGDGTLGPWQATEPLLLPRERHAAVLADGQLFVLGGAGAATSVEHASQGNP